MNNNENIELNYWGEGFQNIYTKPDPNKRTIKQKLAIVISFISVLAILPTTIFAITNFNPVNDQKLTARVTNFEPTQAVSEIPTPTTTPRVKDVVVKGIESNKVKVINNDSYWKISKRTCGTGKYYLSIKEKNDNKALYKDDFVIVDCSL